jgi:glucose/arabinose dehydrogenase
MNRTLARLVALSATVLLALSVAGSVPAHAGVSVQLFKGGLDNPVGFTFAPDGRIFYGERFTGDIHILSANGSTDTLFFHIPNVVNDPCCSEQGLLGIALDPNYPATPEVYAYATRNISGQLVDQIVKIDDNAGVGQNLQVIYSSATVSGSYHDGGRILFGPDGKLYAVQGEAHSSSNAQNLNNTAGKVLRMNTDGSAPADNPFPGKLIWTYGLRNSFGFDFDPQTGNLWESENGPECNDEINRIVKGRNYGWGPHETCSTPPAAPKDTNQDGPNPVMPKAFFTPTVAPVGLAFCDGCGLGAKSSGHFYFAQYNTGRIMRVKLNATRTKIDSMTQVAMHSGTTSIETAPDGTLYISDDHAIYQLV